MLSQSYCKTHDFTFTVGETQFFGFIDLESSVNSIKICFDHNSHWEFILNQSITGLKDEILRPKKKNKQLKSQATCSLTVEEIQLSPDNRLIVIRTIALLKDNPYANWGLKDRVILLFDILSKKWLILGDGVYESDNKKVLEVISSSCIKFDNTFFYVNVEKNIFRLIDNVFSDDKQQKKILDSMLAVYLPKFSLDVVGLVSGYCKANEYRLETRVLMPAVSFEMCCKMQVYILQLVEDLLQKKNLLKQQKLDAMLMALSGESLADIRKYCPLAESGFFSTAKKILAGVTQAESESEKPRTAPGLQSVRSSG